MTDEPLAPLDELSVFVNGAGWYVDSGLDMHTNELWIEADDICLRDMFGRFSYEQMAAILGRTIHATSHRCRQLDLTFASLLDPKPKPDTRRGVA